MNFNILNHRTDLIKSVLNIFKICYLVALPSAQTNLDLGFFTWSLMAIEFIKCTLSRNILFPNDRYDPQIYFRLCWELQQEFVPLTQSGNRTQNLGITLKAPEPYYQDPYCLVLPNSSTYSPNSCEWPPQGLGNFEFF